MLVGDQLLAADQAEVAEQFLGEEARRVRAAVAAGRPAQAVQLGLEGLDDGLLGRELVLEHRQVQRLQQGGRGGLVLHGQADRLGRRAGQVQLLAVPGRGREGARRRTGRARPLDELLVATARPWRGRGGRALLAAGLGAVAATWRRSILGRGRPGELRDHSLSLHKLLLEATSFLLQAVLGRTQAIGLGAQLDEVLGEDLEQPQGRHAGDVRQSAQDLLAVQLALGRGQTGTQRGRLGLLPVDGQAQVVQLLAQVEGRDLLGLELGGEAEDLLGLLVGRQPQGERLDGGRQLAHLALPALPLHGRQLQAARSLSL